MKKVMITTGAAALLATGVQAGGIDRSRLPYGVLFEKGNYVEFSLSRVSPSVSGEYQPQLGGGGTGDMALGYNNMSFAYKQQIDDKLSFGIFVNTPYGANSSYSAGAYTGLNAEWNSEQLALILKYQINPAVSVYGGARYVSSSANILIPDQLIRGGLAAAGSPIAGSAPAGSLVYTADGARDGAFGFLLGAAYERPDIALRVGLTYESKVEHTFKTTEAIPFLAAVGQPLGTTNTDIELPQSLTLDFQSGIAKDTLLFGSIRWAQWSKWEVRPAGYDNLTGTAVTGFEDDIVTYQLGVGRKLNEEFSVFARATYERHIGGVSSRLSPTDGQTAIGIGGTWRKDGIKVMAGVEYAWLGNTFDGSDTQFRSNDALGVGISVGYSF